MPSAPLEVPSPGCKAVVARIRQSHGQPLLRGGYSLGHRTMLDQRSNSAELVDPRDEFSQDMVYHGVYILGV